MAGKPVVEMIGVRKQFLDVVANDDVSLTIREGEICSLLGENGAGKTTLMNVLFGCYTADDGEIRVNGEKVSFASPKDAIARGIGMVHQHFTLVPSQTVLENVIVGSRDNSFFLDIGGARKKLMSLQERFGLYVDPDARVWDLPVGGQQKVEILKALFRDARILILDEPTAVLAPLETQDLFSTLRALAGEGRSVIFISHKLNEVMDIADRVVILRNGRVVDERTVADTDAGELARLMVGRDMGEKRKDRPCSVGKTRLRVRGLHVSDERGLKAVCGVSLDVCGGTITGLAGVSGNGQREFAEVLFGLRVPEEGEIVVDDVPLMCGRPRSAIGAGMGRVPEDRMTTGLMLDLSVEENLILENHRRFLKRGMMDRDAIARYSDGLIAEFGIKTAGRDIPARTLSGGNLQKLILARELHEKPGVIVAAQPTRGLDVGAIEYVHGRILEARENGVAVLLISEDLDEIFALSDNIAVMYEGRIMGVLPIKDATREMVGLWMSGVDVSCAYCS